MEHDYVEEGLFLESHLAPIPWWAYVPGFVLFLALLVLERGILPVMEWVADRRARRVAPELYEQP